MKFSILISHFLLISHLFWFLFLIKIIFFLSSRFQNEKGYLFIETY
ncbi:hypothetical protein LEP1GSC195_1475 [Leptospira wolbachii serovar Codice str. CDC]|uniref:Uncharacterized protein n=1 Tax=Leptospira wolbachii serovar Codice str. CDC TaxID=1218599 RepID=R9A863_9LEPT|nr:hypothetical protein LEP1GSC195_1475 [Leptospira wolbachii serovar Codice str. CDC]